MNEMEKLRKLLDSMGIKWRDMSSIYPQDKSKDRPKRQKKKQKKEYKKEERGRKFNPWIYRYFDVGAEYRKDKEQ